MIMRVSFRQNTFDFRHGDHRKESDKQQKQGQEDAECSNERKNINPGGRVDPPSRREKIPVERNDKDNEALKPHPGIGTHRNEKNSDPISAKSPNPKQLRH